MVRELPIAKGDHTTLQDALFNLFDRRPNPKGDPELERYIGLFGRTRVSEAYRAWRSERDLAHGGDAEARRCIEDRRRRRDIIPGDPNEGEGQGQNAALGSPVDHRGASQYKSHASSTESVDRED